MLDLLLPKTKKRLETEIAALDEARKPNEERREMLKKSTDTPELQREYAAARIERIRLNIDAENRALEIFEYIPLADDQIPVIITEEDQNFNVKVIAQLGGSPQDMWANRDQVNYYQPYIVQSDPAWYPLMSPVTGDLNVSDRVNARVAYNFASKIDVDLWTLLDSIYGTFPTGTYVLDSRIQSFPTTNLINDQAQGALNLEVFKDIFEHFLFIGGGRKVRNIYVPADAPRDIWDLQALVSVSGATGETDASKLVPKEMQLEIFRSGTLNNLFGNVVNIVALNTLASGYLYATTNLPAGKYFHKPGQDRSWHISEAMANLIHRDNQEAVQMRQTVLMLVPAPYRLNTLKVRFK